MPNKIRVLIVDDSILFRKVLRDRLSQINTIEVIDYAVDAFDAQRKIPLLKPDVVTLDVEMPGMSGLDFLKKIMPQYPVPVVLVSSLNLSVFDALSAGAVDFVRKPDMSAQNSVDLFIEDLGRKIGAAKLAKVRKPAPPPTGISPRNAPSMTLENSIKNKSTVIAIGASTGGTEAILSVVKDLPAHTPGIVVVQHMPPGFTAMYAERLNKICKMEVKEAVTGDKVQQGRILIAAGDAHMTVVKVGMEYTVKCFSGEKVSGHRPSVDVLFESVSNAVGSNAVGIILTGMGQDGAKGLLSMRKKGAYTIGQDKESCVVYGMPMVAHNIGAVAVQAPLDNIPAALKKHLNSR